jgi:spore coat protein U-like protein
MKTKKLLGLGFGLTCMASLVAGQAWATVDKTNQFDVTLTVADQCKIKAQNINFPNALPGDSNIIKEVNVSVTCNVPYAVGANLGNNYESNKRRMADKSNASADPIPYTLKFKQGSSWKTWGTANSERYNGSASASKVDIPIRATVSIPQKQAPGDYKDTVDAQLYIK